MKYWVGILTVFNLYFVNAQSAQKYTQSIHGSVYDEITHVKLPRAKVEVAGTRQSTLADEVGDYLLEDLEPGRYNLSVSLDGYETILVHSVWVKRGKVSEQDFYLNPVLDGYKKIASSWVEPGSVEINEEQINRFASTFYDPARLVTTSPDVSLINDRNNLVSARGISPVYNVWRLEGAEIVNPNHLSNMGVLLNKPSLSGGMVNMLSAQMIGQSEFLYGSMSNTLGNSVGGIFNMRLKKGTTQRPQFTAQSSLIGVNLSAEGPLEKNGRITFALNYQYSFTGLLSDAGIHYGPSSINFGDYSMNVCFKVNDHTNLKLFGVRGIGSDHYEPGKETSLAKDQYYIFFDNRTTITGISYNSAFKKGNLKATLAYSSSKNQRTQYRKDKFPEILLFNKDRNDIMSLNAHYLYKLNQIKAEVGLMTNLYFNDISSLKGPNPDRKYLIGPYKGLNPDWNYLVRPYANMSGAFSEKLSWEAGASVLAGGGAMSFNPRGSLRLFLNSNEQLHFAIGRYGQLLNRYNYYFDNPVGAIKLHSYKGIINSYRSSFSYQRTIKAIELTGELFYYYYPKVLISDMFSSQAHNVGLSISAEKAYSSGFYFRSGASLFDARVNHQNSHFNKNYNLKMALGKEWSLSRYGKNRKLSVNIRGMYQGGGWFRYSVSPENTGYSYTSNLQRLGNYLRFDLRLVWTRFKLNRTTSFALDFQNVANNHNVANKYFDTYTNKLETQYQLGLIPILTYRVEW